MALYDGFVEDLASTSNRSVLVHYGVKGMKWGIRRYQNEDGTRTHEGKEREKATRLMRKYELDPKEISKSPDVGSDTVDAVYLDHRQKILTPTDKDSDQVKAAKNAIFNNDDVYMNPNRKDENSEKRHEVATQYCDEFWDLTKQYDDNWEHVPEKKLRDLWNKYRDLYSEALFADSGIAKPDKSSVKAVSKVYRDLEKLEGHINYIFGSIQLKNFANATIDSLT